MKTGVGRLSSEIPAPDGSLQGSGIHRRFHLPRLPDEYYQGDAVVHWTLPIAMREKGWLNGFFHSRFREVMLHASAREHLCCPTYCLMPDHLHLVWMGLRRETDQRLGMKFLREHLGPALSPNRFQHQAHDHVLREDQRKRGAFATVCRYIWENPFKAGLVEPGIAWEYSGSVVPGYPTLNPSDSDFWPKFWKIFFKLRSPDAMEITRPPI